jgi:sortase A
MQPENQRQNPPLSIPPRKQAPVGGVRPQPNQAAANIVRSQIDAIYDKPAEEHAAASQSDDEPQSVYDRTHDEQQHQVTSSAWKRYHSSWQNYYQQYYERYYVGQVYQAKQELEANAKTAPQQPKAALTQEEAVQDLKTELRGKVQTHAEKVRKSRHFMPAMAAVAVMLVFMFLQYNRVLFANVEAYITPGNIDPQNLIIDPNAAVEVGPDPKLIIPKINVNVPIVWDAVASDQNSLNKAMNDGAAWFNIPGANAMPGEIGNSVYSAHSSNDWLDQSKYKFAFARLEQIKEGDSIYINYNSKRYVYTVTHTKVVLPTDVAALTDPIDKPILTLITCVPLGTADKRLLVFADQVSPDPTAATKSADVAETQAAAAMPRNSPSFLERIFGGN